MVRTVAGGVRFSVRVQSRASRSEVCGVHGEALKVRLAAPPVDGAANEALTALLAEAFDVPGRAVTIVSGASARSKLVQVDGIASSAVERLAARNAQT